MSGLINVEGARTALAQLPEGTSHAENPDIAQVYLPPSHVKAMNPDNMLVTGMRGAGKTFWWTALQEREVRHLVYQTNRGSMLSEDTEVRTGFGVRPAPDGYPDKDVIRRLLHARAEPRTIWRTVQAWQLASTDHPIRDQESWEARLNYVDQEPEEIATLFLERDNEFNDKNTHFLFLFDALDRCSDDWEDMYRLIRGLMQTALDMRSYRRLRVKMFLRSDQVDETQIANFPDASKVLSSSVELSWPTSELYGLFWHSLVNGNQAEEFREFVGCENLGAIDVGGKELFQVPRRLISNVDVQREKFHDISGPFMGRNRRRGFPYTWIPNHLGDASGRVSPRSFLRALRTAAEDTAERYPEHEYTLHYEGIKRGVQVASEIRVAEVKEGYPWVDEILKCLVGLTVPCRFEEIEERWNESRVLDHLAENVEGNALKLPPKHIHEQAPGVRFGP